MLGTHGIGHTRMATESRVDIAHSHPFWARPFPDIAVVHNGTITNYHQLRRRLEMKGHRFSTGNDSEVIAVYVADKLQQGESLEDALKASISALDGTFAYLISTDRGIGLARDQFATKPLLYAENDELVVLSSGGSRHPERVPRPRARPAGTRSQGGALVAQVTTFAPDRGLRRADHPGDQPGHPAPVRRRQRRHLA